MPNPAPVILCYCHKTFGRLGSGAAALVLVLVLIIAAACGGESISEKGSRADRVFVMANEGDATAQTALGLLYERGLGVSPDPETAIIWYGRAADQGDSLAMFHIGSLYERGAGVVRDYVVAAEWYRRASDAGNASAQAALAYLYDRGLGVARDFSEAEALYSRASAQWTEIDKYPADATFATGREVPALAGPGVEALPTYGGRPEFTAGKEDEPSIEINLNALDEVPDPPEVLPMFDGPEPIAGKGENFPLVGSSLQAPISAATAVPQSPSPRKDVAPTKILRLPMADDAGDATPSPTTPIFMVSLATYETETLALAALGKIRSTHAGLLDRLSYELQPVDMGDEGQSVELIVGPIDSLTRSRSLCAVLRTHEHVCRIIDR